MKVFLRLLKCDAIMHCRKKSRKKKAFLRLWKALFCVQRDSALLQFCMVVCRRVCVYVCVRVHERTRVCGVWCVYVCVRVHASTRVCVYVSSSSQLCLQHARMHKL